MLEAANYLLQTSELFQKEHTHVQENWQENVVAALSDPTAVGISNINECEEFFNVPTTSSSVPDLLSSKNISENIQNAQVSVNGHIDEIATNSNDNNTDNNDDVWYEVEEQLSGVTDTVLEQPDITENLEELLSFAPGGGNRPLGIFMDKDSKFLTFLTIFCGKTRPDNKDKKHQCLTVQCVSGNEEVEIGELQNQ